MALPRDARSRFQIGHAGGPGRPKRQTEAAYLAAILEEVPLATWREVVCAAVDGAKAGDHRPRYWLARYLLGDPAPWHGQRWRQLSSGYFTTTRRLSAQRKSWRRKRSSG